MLLTVQSSRSLVQTCPAPPSDHLGCQRVPGLRSAGCSPAPRRWRLSVLAQEELPLTVPDSFGSIDLDEPARSSQLVVNDNQIERLLSHIHKRLPHSKPARALLRASPHPTQQLHPDDDDDDCDDDSPPSLQQQLHHPQPDFEAADGQLHLSLDGSGISLTVLEAPAASAPLQALDQPAPPADWSPSHGAALLSHQELLTSFADTLAAGWAVPGAAGPLEAAPRSAPLVVSGAPPQLQDSPARQRQWLQQLLDRPPAAEHPAAPKQQQQQGQEQGQGQEQEAPVPQARTTGARTKACGCGAVLHNRVAACPHCGHQFYSAGANRQASTAKPRRKRAAKAVSQHAAPSTSSSPAAAAAATAAHALPAAPAAPRLAAPVSTAAPAADRRDATAEASTSASHSHPRPHPASHAAPAPAAASTGGRAASGDSVEALAAAMGMPVGAARRLITTNPNMGTLPAAKVAGRVQQMAAVLAMTRELALSVALRQPSLLSLTPATLRQHFEGLCTHLHLPPREMRRVVAKCPDLLLMAPGSAARKLQRIAAMLRVSPVQVLQLAVAAPKLVSLSVDNLRDKLLFCRDTLGLKQPASLHKVLQAHPSLLTRSAGSMRARFEGTAALLGLSHEEARRAFQLMPALLYKHCDSVEAKVAQLAELLGVPVEQATRLAAQNLGLLAMDAAAWSGRVDALAAALGLPREAVLKMLARLPSLLGLKPAPLGERLRKTAGRLKLPLERVRQMVEVQPSLLTIKLAVLVRRWQALCTLAAAEPAWRRQLLGYEVSTMAVLLSRSDDTFLRLQFLAASGAGSSMAVTSAAQMRASHFRARYPDFEPWVNEVVLRSRLAGRRVGKVGVLRAVLRASAAGSAPVPPAAAQAQ